MNERNTSQRKHEVQNFYDSVGWNKEGEQLYADAVFFEDLRPVSASYRHDCHLRVNRYLPAGGKYLLDVASGPIQCPEYLTYSENFDYRICGDISLSALTQARETLGDKGLYVQLDIVYLPFKDNGIDGIVSSATIYHVPQQEQKAAILELHRVLKPGSTAVIIYNWSRYSALMLVTAPYKIWMVARRAWRKLTRPLRNEAERPALYFYVHPYRWFIQNIQPAMMLDFVVWRSVNVYFLKMFIHPRLFGERLLKAIYNLEENHPRFFGRHGAYPMIIIKK